MSTAAVGLDIDQGGLQNIELSWIDYFQKVASDRGHHIFEVPKIVIESFGHGLKAASSWLPSLAFCGARLANFANLLDKVVRTENIVFFAQDVLALPKECKALVSRAIQWRNEEVSLKEFAHQGRKFVGHIGSTVGDYVGSCSILKDLRIPGIMEVTDTVNNIGNLGSAIGAASRIADYALEETAAKTELTALQKIKESIKESRQRWDLTRDVSVFSLSVLSLIFGFSALNPIVSVGLSATILGSRMAGYYQSCKERAVDESTLQRMAAKKIVKI